MLMSGNIIFHAGVEQEEKPLDVFANENGLMVKQIRAGEERYEVFAEDVQIGEAQLYNYGDDIHIDNLELFTVYQRKGYGKRVVDLLLSVPPVVTIRGESVPAAIPF